VYLDGAWIARGTIAVFGWSPFPAKGLNWTEGIEGWILHSYRRNNGGPAADKRN
jgi:hypothetical protein